LIQRHSAFFCVLLIACTSFVAAQSAPGAAPASPARGQSSAPSAQPGPAPAAPTAPSTAVVPENSPVITIDGVCDVSLNGTAKAAPSTRAAGSSSTAAKSSASHSATTKSAAARTSTAHPADCKTEITRAEFEKLLKAVAPNAPATVNRQIAARYVQLLTAANKGVEMGVTKDPEYEEQLAIARLQVLAQTAERKIQTEAANVSEADEKAYYDQNPSAFEEVTLTRVFIPRNPSTANNTGSGTTQQPSSTPDPQAIADEAHKQLVARDDPEKVEKTAYEQLKNTTAPPSTKFGSRRRGSLPPAQESKIFAMNPGDVSEVFSDSIGYTIYKLDAKKQLPFDQVKDDIKRRLTQQHLEDARQQITGASKAEYNDAYFGPEGGPARPAAARPSATPGTGAASANPSTTTESPTPK